MQNAKGARIAFTADVSLEDRGDYWAAYIEPTGMTVYGDTKAAAIARADQAMGFFTKHYADGDHGLQKIRAYLDWHGVPSLVTYPDAPNTPKDYGIKRIQYPVSFSFETAASV